MGHSRPLQQLQAFRYHEDPSPRPTDPATQSASPRPNTNAPASNVTTPTASPPASRKRHRSRSSPLQRPQLHLTPAGLANLAPMLLDTLILVFVGFNPGVESSRTQHHYAHHTNLFWKLFNRLKILAAVAHAQHLQTHPLVKELAHAAAAKDDDRLVAVGIGFTDLVLRCTRAASELSPAEKRSNVPRVLREIRTSGASHVVVVGKGVWESMARVLVPHLRPSDFGWGLQTDPKVGDVFYRACGRRVRVFVVPSTSGLVGLVSYADKLALWNEVADSLAGTGVARPLADFCAGGGGGNHLHAR